MDEKFKYAEFVVGSVNNRNNILDFSTFTLQKNGVDCFRSLFLFDDHLKSYVEKNKSTKGYSGPHIADSLIFDFDGTDLEIVKKETANFILYLHHTLELPLDYIRVSFSGKKGFHVIIPFNAIKENPVPSNSFWCIYKALALEIAGEFNIDKNIYTLNRIIRLNNTINSKSGLYKIPLTWTEINDLSIDEIKQLAKSERKIPQLPISEISPIDALAELFEKWNKNNVPNHNLPTKIETTDGDLFSSVKEGERNTQAIKLCGYLMKKSFSEQHCLCFMKVWNQQNLPPLPEEELKTLVASAYKRYEKEISTMQVFSMKEAVFEYSSFVRNLQTNKIKLGFPKIDEATRGIMRGEVVTVIGKTSVGKSAFMQSVGLNVSRSNDQPVLFFSMEMPIATVAERALQMELELTGSHIERTFLTDQIEAEHLAKTIIAKVPNFYTVTKSGLDLHMVRQYIEHAENKIYNKRTGLVLLDYLGLLKSKGSNTYEKVSEVSRALKDLAKEMNVPVMLLAQTTKANEPYSELTLGSVRDSGVTDEASDFVFGLWRDPAHKQLSEKSDHNFIYLIMGILKNRRGRLGLEALKMDKSSLKFSSNTKHV